MSKINAPKPVIQKEVTPTVTVILPELAAEIGLNDSIMLMQIAFWISTTNLYIDGQYWTYQSTGDMQSKAFPYWSRSTINRAAKKLVEKGLLFEGSYNKAKFDRTPWYALNPDGISQLKSISLTWIDNMVEPLIVCQNDTSVCQNDTRRTQNDTTIPEITTETPTEITTDGIAPNGAARWIAQLSLMTFIKDLIPALQTANEELEAKRERPIQIAAIINAKVVSDIDRKIPHNKQANPWMNKTERGWCEAIIDAGFTPEDVVAYIADLVQEPFWHGRSISLKYIAQNIRAWAEKPVEPERASFQEFKGELPEPLFPPERWDKHRDFFTSLFTKPRCDNAAASTPS